jgi:hypothetical protein
MSVIVFVFVLTLGTSYVFRKQLFWWLFLAARWCLQFKLAYQARMTQSKVITYKGKRSWHCEDKVVNVHRYEVSNSNYIVLSEKEYLASEHVYQTIIENLPSKHNILNCSINDSGDNCMVDLTHLLRQFLYHFHDQHETSKLKYFIRFVEHEYGFSFHGCYLVMYVNDETFTERKHVIDQELYEKYYSDIVGL